MLLALETWASSAWLPLYYRFGIPISVQRARISASAIRPAELAQSLETRFQAQPGGAQTGRLVHPTLLFRVLPGAAGALLAFRERLFEDRPGGRYLPVMHATARLSQQDGSAGVDITVTGYLNWTILYVIGYLVYRGSVEARFVPVALLISVVLLLSYAAQNSVNGKVAQQIATLARVSGRSGAE